MIRKIRIIFELHYLTIYFNSSDKNTKEETKIVIEILKEYMHKKLLLCYIY